MENPDANRQKTVSGTAGIESFSVRLTKSDLQEIEGRSTAKKAEWIVRKLIEHKFGPGVRIDEDREGADLRISVNGRTERIEVKGTKSKDIAWAKLKVSSQQSCDALRTGSASMYRVTDVDGSEPRVHILKHGRDYELKPEPRWAVRPAGSKAHPLRGRPYRYEQPHQGVAAGEWGVPG